MIPNIARSGEPEMVDLGVSVWKGGLIRADLPLMVAIFHAGRIRFSL
jgi:hypothetical protein